MKYAGVSVVGLLLLSACSATDAPEAAVEEAAGPELVEGINIADARMVLAPVSGNPAAVYFDLTYVGDEAISFESAEVEGAQSTMIHIISEDENGAHMMDHGPFEVASGETVEFKPGALHIMVMGVPDELNAGSTAPVTLAFSDGTTHSFEAEVRSAGEER